MAENNNPATWMEQDVRPQLLRGRFYSLCGTWQLNGKPICVPYPPQAAFSQFGGEVPESLHYETTFTLPEGFAHEGEHILLHFGAVDQMAHIFINGRPAARHEGGYLPFCADITALLQPGENTLLADVTDTLDTDYPYGKQTTHPHGMWYTPVSGIWQPVWLEAVPQPAVNALRVTPSLTGILLEVDTAAESYTVTISAKEKSFTYTYTEKAVQISLAAAGLPVHHWAPGDPFLYSLTVSTGADTVESHFALRTVEMKPVNGINRLCLNGKPLFLHGVLDQGYFMDGIFLPGSPAEYEKDILRMKGLGFNLLRKHIKIEPEAFYAACDRLGMLVMQDMVNSGTVNFLRDTALPTAGFLHKSDHVRGARRRKVLFEEHALATQRHLYNHPCIIGYTIFNEGWGQFDADRMYALCKKEDPTRFYDATSGWFAQKDSDVDSRHIYFRLKKLTPQTRPMLLSECGGYVRPIDGHEFRTGERYGYGAADTEERLTAKIAEMYEKMVLPAIPQGLCGCIYTQLCDVESEVNGLYTYDRAVCKVNTEEMLQIAKKIDALVEKM